jgi:hypothetical protein
MAVSNIVPVTFGVHFCLAAAPQALLLPPCEEPYKNNTALTMPEMREFQGSGNFSAGRFSVDSRPQKAVGSAETAQPETQAKGATA